jgi:phage baseplate assembly protein W
MTKRLFTGFSTIDSEKTRQRTFYDLELCKRDLMNHFHTRPGERVMRPAWGCRIWEYMMEPMTASTKEIIEDEATNVILADPRCQLISVEASETTHGIRVEITINFIPDAVVETFAIDFDRRNTSFFA